MTARVVTLTILLALAASQATAQARPNVVLIYADDLGYGDVSSYSLPRRSSPESRAEAGARRLKTPNIDRLAREGVRFTDAHAPAATCTPSRYAMLTGEYAWRKAGTGILPGNAALIVEPGRTTLASVFQRAGYATGVVGKWHLGLGPAGDRTGMARFARARRTSASTPPSSWPPPATGCLPSTSKIAASSASTPPTRSV